MLRSDRSIARRKIAIRNSTRSLHLMMLPSVVLLLIFAYIPMAGIVIGFQDFDVINLARGYGFFGSDWIGFDNFLRVWNMPGSIQALRNTVNIAFWRIVTMLIIPIIVSLLLNEVRKNYVKRTIQTLVYLPYFLSWVILGGVLRNVLGAHGIVNQMIQAMGFESISFLGDPNIFPWTIIWSNVWQNFGFSTIVFLAAITGIDPSLYEAAVIDGASRWKQTWHVTLPGMRPIIVLSMVLSLGQILNAGFDQIFNLYSVPVYETGDIIDTFIFRLGIGQGEFGVATAVGLFRSLVALLFISVSYWGAKKFAGYEIF